MNLLLELIGLGVAAPAAIAAVLYIALPRLLPSDLASRYAAPIAFGVGCVTGNLLSGSSPVVPDRHWHWLPYLAVGTSGVGAVAAAKSLRYLDRLALWVAAAIVAALWIVPSWPSLEPPRAAWVAFVATGFAASTVVLDPLLTKTPTRSLFWSLSLTAFGVAVLVAAFVSLTTGKAALSSAAALLGCAVASMLGRPAPAAGLALPFTIVIGGWSFVGAVEPQPPILFLMLAPLAPLALWCFVAGPLAKLRGVTAVAARLASVAVVVAIAAAGATFVG